MFWILFFLLSYQICFGLDRYLSIDDFSDFAIRYDMQRYIIME